LAPHTYVDDPIEIAVPENLAPDTYYLGFLVTPTPDAASVRVVNQIGALLTLDIPGPRQRDVRAEPLHVPRFVFGRSVRIRFSVRNIGPSFAKTWTELHVKAPGRTELFHPFVARQLVPSGHTRTFSWRPALPFVFGLVHVRALAFYNRTDQQIAQSEIQRTVFIIDPIFLVIALGLGLLVVIAVIRRRRRRARAARQRAMKGREPSQEQRSRKWREAAIVS
jgi:hypothetical protein